jgi:hypothetical protein
MFKSKLRVVSIGIAAENKDLNSHKIPIVPIELMPAVDGELMDTLEDISVNGVDKNARDYTVTVKASSTLTATWLPHGSNRVTSPDVRRGEHLLIWQYADVDQYYWTPKGIDDDLRRLETVIYAWSATRDETVPLDPSDNMYALEISTHGKHITLHTTQADGEPFEYTLQLDTQAGKFFLTDNVGNTVTLDSAKTVIQAINKDLTEVTLNRKSLHGYAQDQVRARSDDSMQVSSGGDTTLYVEGDLNQYVGGNWNVMVEGDKTEVVMGQAGHYHVGGHTTFSDAMVALDGSGANLQSGMAGPVDPGGIEDGAKWPIGGSQSPKPKEISPNAEPLSSEYGIKSTEAIRASAGRYAALDEEGEIGATPSYFPDDAKPAGYTGKPKSVSSLSGGERPTGDVTTTTEVTGSIDYDQQLGNTDFTIGDLSIEALFPHRIADQGGFTAQEIVWNMEALATKILQPLKEEVGEFRINSAFRRGSGRSQHTKGMAVDIQNPGWSSQRYMEVAEWVAANLPCDQLIFEHGNSIWLHISFDRTKDAQRGQLLTMLNGNYEPGLKNYYA